MSSRSENGATLGAVALILGLGLVASSNGTAIPSEKREPVPPKGSILVRRKTRLGPQKVMLPISEILMWFTEYRTDQPWRVGMTVVWTKSWGTVVIFDRAANLVSQIGDEAVLLHIQPRWRDDLHELDTDEVVPIWIPKSAVSRVESSSVISHEKRSALGRVYFNGRFVDVLEPVHEVRRRLGKA